MNFEVVLCLWLPNWWTNKVMSACIYARSWSTFCDVTLRDRLMPVVMTVRHASSTHKISAQWCWDVLRWLKHEEHTRYWFCAFRNLGTGVCGVVIGANVHRMVLRIPLLNDQRYWSKTFEWNACMRLELADTNVKRAFLVCVGIYTIWTVLYSFDSFTCFYVLYLWPGCNKNLKQKKNAISVSLRQTYCFRSQQLRTRWLGTQPILRHSTIGHCPRHTKVCVQQYSCK